MSLNDMLDDILKELFEDSLLGLVYDKKPLRNRHLIKARE